MPVLVVTVPTAGPIGFGLTLAGTTSGGTFSAGDYVDAVIYHPGSSLKICQGTVLKNSGTSWRLTFETHVQEGALQNDPVDLDVVWNSGGVNIDSQTFSGVYVNDSITGLGPLVAAAAAGGGSHDPMLDDILAAVTKTITNSP